MRLSFLEILAVGHNLESVATRVSVHRLSWSPACHRAAYSCRGCMKIFETFDEAWIFYKVLKIACKILRALQLDCIIEVYIKFQMHFAKKICAQHGNFLQYFVMTFRNFFKEKWFEYMVRYFLSNFPSSFKNFPCALFLIRLEFIQNWTIGIIYSFHRFLIMTFRNFHFGEFSNFQSDIFFHKNFFVSWMLWKFFRLVLSEFSMLKKIAYRHRCILWKFHLNPTKVSSRFSSFWGSWSAFFQNIMNSFCTKTWC